MGDAEYFPGAEREEDPAGRGEPWTRDFLSLFLRVEGCSPHVAASATEAIAALSAGRFDLIICEYWLADMDGLSFLKLFGDCHPGAVKILTSSYMPPGIELPMRLKDRCRINPPPPKTGPPAST